MLVAAAVASVPLVAVPVPAVRVAVVVAGVTVVIVPPDSARAVTPSSAVSPGSTPIVISPIVEEPLDLL
jgi:hypothetical protein